jgi:hypothetical protein
MFLLLFHKNINNCTRYIFYSVPLTILSSTINVLLTELLILYTSNMI